jgi:LysR family glycine cleavage system transcriptional activator
MDLVVSRRPIHTADVECVPLLEDASVAICGRKLAERFRRMAFPQLLEKTPLLFLENEPTWNGTLSDPRINPGRILRAATIDEPRAVLDAATQECGVAYLPRVLCQGAIDSGGVVVLPQVPEKSLPRLWLMRSRLPVRTPFVNRVFDWFMTNAHT